MALAIEIFIFVSTILTVVCYVIRKQYSFWKDKNLPYIPNSSLLGNTADHILFRKSAAELLSELYNHEKAKDQPAVGIYICHKPAILVRDLELIKRVLIKDFNKFSDRYTSADPHGDVVGANNLFFLKNPDWKKLRNSLTPVFSSGKLKQMFYLINDVGINLDLYLKSLPFDNISNRTEVEIKDICALYTTDVIASVAYGLEANSLKNPNCEFREAGRKVFHFTRKRGFEFSSLFFLPQIVAVLKLKVFSKEVTEFLRTTISFALKERESSGRIRNDLIDSLLQIRNSPKNFNENGQKIIDGDQLVAHAAIFFTAGFETSSSAMTSALYELSKKPDMLRRLRKEIRNAFTENNDQLSYDSIQNMEYLTKVIQETLRLYPTLPFLDRECTPDVGEKGYSLEPHTDFIVPKKMPVLIPLYAIQRDPKYFPNPDDFDPERFSRERKCDFNQFSHFPFGAGPHNCIGERMGIMQAKIGLCFFLKNHTVRPSLRTPLKFKLEKNALLTQPEGGVIYLDVVKDYELKF